MNCLYDDTPLERKERLNDDATGIAFTHYDCPKCGRMFDAEKNIIDENGNCLNDKGEPIGETSA